MGHAEDMREMYEELGRGANTPKVTVSSLEILGWTPVTKEQYALPGLEEPTKQVGGDHYSSMVIQPVDYILANNLGYLEGNVIKYVSRHLAKNGLEDIDKAIHYLELIKEKHYENIK